MKPYVKPLILAIVGFIFLSIGLIGVVIGSWETIPKLYCHYNPPVYNPPQDATKISSEKLLTLINQERQNKRLTPFQENKTLAYIAYLRAKNIFDTQEFTHEATRSGLTSDKLAIKIGYFYESLSENLAIGSGTEKEIVEAWKQSKKHAEIMFTNEVLDAGVFSQGGLFYGDEKIVTVLILGKAY